MPSEEHEKKIEDIITAFKSAGFIHFQNAILKERGTKIPDAVFLPSPRDKDDESHWIVLEVGDLRQESMDCFKHTTLLWVPKSPGSQIIGLWISGVSHPPKDVPEAIRILSQFKEGNWEPKRTDVLEIEKGKRDKIIAGLRDRLLKRLIEVQGKFSSLSMWSNLMVEALENGKWTELFENTDDYKIDINVDLTENHGIGVLHEILVQMEDHLEQLFEDASQELTTAKADIEKTLPDYS